MCTLLLMTAEEQMAQALADTDAAGAVLILVQNEDGFEVYSRLPHKDAALVLLEAAANLLTRSDEQQEGPSTFDEEAEGTRFRNSTDA